MKNNKDENKDLEPKIETNPGVIKPGYAVSVSKAGELFNSTKEIYEQSGHKVIYFDPWNIMNSES